MKTCIYANTVGSDRKKHTSETRGWHKRNKARKKGNMNVRLTICIL